MFVRHLCYYARVLAILVLPLLLGCAASGLFTDPKPHRVISVKVVADPDFASHSLWKENARRLVEAASKHYMSWYEIAFTIDTMIIWDSDSSACAHTMFPHDCLLNSIDKGSSDLVIHFAKERNPYRLPYLGLSLFEFGYVRVVQAEWIRDNAGFQTAFLTLLHELGHMFGAYHIVPDGTDKTLFMMNPMFSERLIVNEGMSSIVKIPDWSAANEYIIRRVRDRPFDEAKWDSLSWIPIQNAFVESRRQFNNHSFGPDGFLKVPHNQTHRIADHYYFLGAFAALSGFTKQALAYVDTMKMIVDAQSRQCTSKSGPCPRAICEDVPSRAQSHGEWRERELAGLALVRAQILARGGDTHGARRAFLEFYEAIPKSEGDLRSKYQRGFDAYLQHALALKEQTKRKVEEEIWE